MSGQLVSDKQFYIVLGIGAVVVVAGGYLTYKAAKYVTNTVGGAVDAVSDGVGGAVGWVEDDLSKTANFINKLGEGLHGVWDWAGFNDVKDKFDLNYRDQLPNMNDEEYQRWKTAVQKGDIENPFKPIF